MRENSKAIRNLQATDSQLRAATLSRFREQYAAVDARDAKAGGLAVHEGRVYSQNGEDGILLYIFSQIGVTNHTFVEVGASDGIECNTANLSLNFGWSGLLLEGDPAAIARGTAIYRDKLGGAADRIQFKQAFVNAENINDLISGAGIDGEIDLLTIDIDGNDYWIWNAISVIQPRGGYG